MTARDDTAQTETGQAAGYRVEHDSMGEVRVPLNAKWQAQTQRAVDNFPVSGQQIDRALVRAWRCSNGPRRWRTPSSGS